MPLLDVTDVLDDPDFQTTIDVIRATEVVDAHGRASGTPIVDPIDSNVPAVVEAAAGFSLQRLAEGERQGGAIYVYSRYRLSDGRGAEEAHVVFWNNAHWIVVQVDDWSQYGDGYIRAVCDLSDVNVAS